MFSAFELFGHLGEIFPVDGDEGAIVGPPANGYVAEDGVTNYVAEDGVTFYVQEH